MATLNFLYRSTRENSNLNIRLLFRHNSNDYVIGAKTLLKVSKVYWERQHNQKRPKNIDVANHQLEIKSEMNNIENFILSAFDKIIPELVNKNWLQNQIDLYYNKEPEKNLIPIELVKFIDYYNEERKGEITLSSIKKHKVVKHKLERYEKAFQKIVLISDIDENFKAEFVEYCKSENYALGTIQRDLVFIKTFCNYAYEKGLDVSRNLNKVRIKVKTEIKHPYLSFDELKGIEEKEFNESLDNVKDWLIISCYTGQRISDFMNFSSKMIREEKGNKLLEFKQKKTGKLMTIPLHSKVLAILEKRNGDFPKAISDQKYNEMLKIVCKESGITEKISGSKKMEIEPDTGIYRKEEGLFEKWELIASHVGRRSFASNFYGKIPTNYLIYITGHSTETMFLNYIGKSNKDLALEITNYFN
ncbi:phage integrase SAM-like domain-containing protein [Chryseobacterium sp. M5A1_1a]